MWYAVTWLLFSLCLITIAILAILIVGMCVCIFSGKKMKVKHERLYAYIRHYGKTGVVCLVIFALLFGLLGSLTFSQYENLEKPTVLYRDQTVTGHEVVVLAKGKLRAPLFHASYHVLSLQVDGKEILTMQMGCLFRSCVACYGGTSESLTCLQDDSEFYTIVCGSHFYLDGIDTETCDQYLFTFTSDFEALTDYKCKHFTIHDENLEIRK